MDRIMMSGFHKARGKELSATKTDYRKLRKALEEFQQGLADLLESTDPFDRQVQIDRGWLLELEEKQRRVLRECPQ